MSTDVTNKTSCLGEKRYYLRSTTNKLTLSRYYLHSTKSIYYVTNNVIIFDIAYTVYI